MLDTRHTGQPRGSPRRRAQACCLLCAQGELELVLPLEVQAYLDLRTLEVCLGSFVDEDLRHTHTDLLYRVKTREGGDALVYLLMEHQSTFACRSACWLPIVLPVVLHHDIVAWRPAPES